MDIKGHASKILEGIYHSYTNVCTYCNYLSISLLAQKIIDNLEAQRDGGLESQLEEKTKMNPKVKFYRNFFANALGSRIERKDENGQSTRDYYLRNIRSGLWHPNHPHSKGLLQNTH